MAKCKYLENKICKKIDQSLDKLMNEHLIPNTISPTNGQEFRDNHLWTLEVDDLFKSNMNAIKDLYKHFSTYQSSVGKPKFFGHEDAITLCRELPLQVHQIIIAYTISKQVRTARPG